MYVIALDFGYPINPRRRSTIDDLSDYLLAHYARQNDCTILAQEYCYQSVMQYAPKLLAKVDLIDVAQSQLRNFNGLQDGGSYYVLKMAQQMIHPKDADEKIVLVTHQLLASRALHQAQLLGLEMELAADLPGQVYRNARQWWCRNRPCWYLREICGYPFLKFLGQV